ncbi:Enamine deaminase RidA, house cleaning of reactive enamine intermediates, YjgF/YER057c/UK114 family [Oceanicella actignis]|uniref:Enamine deaminase RidA, house cleaning of reactive enamine intermediates, YjgF/YER057c/UK114 family n=1 Tax=Oceanicella actignis TaxID=1189325 RepID=A0A1M7SXE9_9RHOB|nr:Enamine deaminase RidA, house cleaning of reactive enamine intermediates, YjgF/YER057c/UK114 family [Oceanicella actignis]SHN63054.1 Enamine deaminase RidA, house cleaning of reactive enamine intermediates, YjgF/YER057c/UK114 family [Oceanicella actignis]
MSVRRISTGSSFERDYAYSRAVVRGPWCFVSGTTGYDYADMTMPESAAEQAENAFATIARTLREAGFSMRDIVRVQYHVTDPAHWQAAAPVVRRWLGDAPPAATLIVAGLLRPEMKIEIEATALRDV